MIKCSHMFNLLDARGAISVSERVGGQFIGYLADAASVPTAFLIGGIACIGVALLLVLMPASIAGASTALGVEESPVRAVASAS